MANVNSVVGPPDQPHDMTGHEVTFRMLDSELPPPSRAHPGDAGLDLRCREDVRLEPGARAAVATGVAVAIPEGYAGFVLPRSGHAARHGVGLVNAPGLIDSGYRGEVTVLLVNHGDEPVSFDRGSRVAQLVVMPVPVLPWVQADDLPDTSRGAGGFGSTGS